jgi:hypothetical protein
VLWWPGQHGTLIGRLEELSAGSLVGKDIAGFYLVDPAVQFQYTARQPRGDHRVSAEVVHLRQHIFLDGDVEQFISGR